MALKEDEVQHLNPEVLAYANKHPNTYNTLTLSKALILSVLGLKTHQTYHLAQKTFAVTFRSFSFPIGESFSLDVAKLRMV